MVQDLARLAHDLGTDTVSGNDGYLLHAPSPWLKLMTAA
jgi:hypothetical protein